MSGRMKLRSAVTPEEREIEAVSKINGKIPAQIG